MKDLCEKVVEVRMCHRVMAVLLVFHELMLIYGYAHQRGDISLDVIAAKGELKNLSDG